MTVATEWAKRFQRLQYVLCIEGVGWVNKMQPSNGFDTGSVVWTTADIDGTIASDLGSITVYEGLEINGSISEELNPKTMEYKVGGMTFDIVDHDGWWLSNLTPRKSSTAQALAADLSYYETDINIDDGSGYSEDDEVWIGHRELVRLGSKSLVSGTEYKFASSTRGHKGTRRGSFLRGPGNSGSAKWTNGTSTNSVGRFWLNRKVTLWAHVPGESASNLELLWAGKLSDIVTVESGHKYRLNCSGDWLGDINATAQQREWELYEELHSSAVSTSIYTGRVFTLLPVYPGGAVAGNDWVKYAMALWYNYRWVSGGTDGAISAWDGALSSVQAATNTELTGSIYYTTKRIDELIYVKGVGVFIGLFMHGSNKTRAKISQLPAYGGESTYTQHVGVSDADGGEVHDWTELHPVGAPKKVRFLLSNWINDYTKNRFQINKSIPTNPIDVALCLMMSRDGEYEIFDAAASSTDTTVKWSGTGRATDLYAGKALFSVEDNNKYESRVISSQDTTDIVVERAFTNSATLNQEYQIRESIYDCLPAGWGMGMIVDDVDIDSFLSVKDSAMSSAKVDRFCLGAEDLSVWELLRENIFKPYGVLVYLDRSTRKISAKHIGEVASDGVLESLTDLNTDNIYKVGDTSWNFQAPISSVKLSVRSVAGVPTTVRETFSAKKSPTGSIYRNFNAFSADRPGGKDDLAEINVTSAEFESSIDPSSAETFEISATLASVDTADDLILRGYGLLSRYSLAIPVIDLAVDMSLYNSLQVGSHCVISDLPHAANPFTGARGLSSVVGRVVSTKFSPNNPILFNCKIELFETLNLAKIAPAAELTGSFYGSDGTSDWFEVKADAFVADSDNDSDLYKFAVGDRIIVRDTVGDPYDGVSSPYTTYTIRSFGSNDVSDPTAAASNVIRVNETITSTGSLAAGDTITFAPWSGSNTARMDNYCAMADSSSLLPATDAAREYAGG